MSWKSFIATRIKKRLLNKQPPIWWKMGTTSNYFKSNLNNLWQTRISIRALYLHYNYTKVRFRLMRRAWIEQKLNMAPVRSQYLKISQWPCSSRKHYRSVASITIGLSILSLGLARLSVAAVNGMLRVHSVMILHQIYIQSHFVQWYRHSYQWYRHSYQSQRLFTALCPFISPSHLPAPVTSHCTPFNSTQPCQTNFASNLYTLISATRILLRPSATHSYAIHFQTNPYLLYWIKYNSVISLS